MLLSRSLETTLRRYGQKFPVVLVTGARQVGKSTLLKATVPHANYVSLDDPAARLLAQTEPKLFLARYTTPVIIDEVQYAPQLFSLIKMAVDEAPERKGQYWLSGSQQFHMMKNVSESMAGRVGILQLAGLSTRELLGDAAAPPLIERLMDDTRPSLSGSAVFDRIWRGSYGVRVHGLDAHSHGDGRGEAELPEGIVERPVFLGFGVAPIGVRADVHECDGHGEPSGFRITRKHERSLDIPFGFHGAHLAGPSPSR